MPQLPWIRFEVNLPRNPKVLALLEERGGYQAAWLYICGLAYAGEHGTDGFIPVTALVTFGRRYARSDAVRDALLLVIHRLWDVTPGGWNVHDWAEFQASSDETRARSDRARQAAESRWSGHKPRSGAERQAAYRARHKDW